MSQEQTTAPVPPPEQTTEGNTQTTIQMETQTSVEESTQSTTQVSTSQTSETKTSTTETSNLEEEKKNVTAIPSEPTPPPPPPNYLVVSILEAKNILALDGSGVDATSDPFVTLNMTYNPEQRSVKLKKTLRPRWRQTFYFNYLPSHTKPQVLSLVLEDNDTFVNDFLGQLRISMTQWAALHGTTKKVLWLALEPQDAKERGKDMPLFTDVTETRKLSYGRGKICLAMQLCYIDRNLVSLEQGEEDNETPVPRGSSILALGVNNETAKPGEVEEDDGGFDQDNGEGEDAEKNDEDGAEADSDEEELDADGNPIVKETEDVVAKRAEEREKMFAELNTVQFLSGDYSVQVRIIEVRDLKPMDVNGLCDPVVSVELLGMKQYTVVKKKKLSCVFDEYLYFNFRKLDKEKIRQATIKISVCDADGPSILGMSDLIGFFTIDIPFVYFQKDHELHRKWVALVGNNETNLDEIMGYLLLSVVVLGPNDKLRVRSAEEDMKEQQTISEIARGTSKDINNMVLLPPRVSQTLKFLVVTVHMARDIPDMDGGLMKHGGIDAYVKAVALGGDALETKIITVKGSGNLAIDFHQELWFPILLPSMNDTILLSMWDFDNITANEIVGNIEPISFQMFLKYPHLFDRVWYNLYGPPLNSRSENPKRMIMFDHPSQASTYRGRVLISLRLADPSASSSTSKATSRLPHTRRLLNVDRNMFTLQSYTLRCALFYGTEIPKFASRTNWNRNSKMSIQISIGQHILTSTRVPNINGTCQWNQYLEIPNVELAADVSQCPDIFIHLVRQKVNSVTLICFARLSAKKVFDATQNMDSSSENTLPPPTWLTLREDAVLDHLNDRDFTGNLLLTCALERNDKKNPTEMKQASAVWRDYSFKRLTYRKYTLLVHVFQGRSLPSADRNGLLDPFVTVTCAGAEGKVNKRLDTRDPCFYETVALDVELPVETDFLPNVSLQVYDWDKWDTDDYVGSMKFSLKDFSTETSTSYIKRQGDGTYAPPRPEWYPLSYIEGVEGEGELLISFDLIQKDIPSIVIKPPASIRPPSDEKFLEIICLGARQLSPLGFMPVNSPFMKFDIGDSATNEAAGNNAAKYTNSSSQPTPNNPNFLERIVIPIRVPKDALFAPRLNISVYDQHLGGFYKPLLGVGSVDLVSKVPMSNGKPNPMYKPPGGGPKDVQLKQLNPYVEKDVDFSTFPGATSSRPNFTVATDPEHPEAEKVANEANAGETPSEDPCEMKPCEQMEQYIIGEDDTPHYLKGRSLIENPLETALGAPPFETYALYTGSMLVRQKWLTSSGSADNESKYSSAQYKPVGFFKGMIRIIDKRTDPPLFDLKDFLNPQPYLVRIYVLSASNLQPKDENHSSDPYLCLSLGDGSSREHVINDRDNYKARTLNPKFHQCFEFKAQLPGACELHLDVMDYDYFALSNLMPTGVSKNLEHIIGGSSVGGDDLIGSTIIDLEDRWFSKKWQELGYQGENQEKKKPLEIRPLFAPSSTLAQGNITLWLDILTPLEMEKTPKTDISLPPIEDYEVRVVVYRAKDVTPGDILTEMSDLYVKAWFQELHADDEHSQFVQKTDTHFRAQEGRASFNWRMKFPVQLPIDPSKELERGTLHFQLWDKDLLYDDCLADTVVDLTYHLKDAYKTKKRVNIFEKKKFLKMSSSVVNDNTSISPIQIDNSEDIPAPNQESSSLLAPGAPKTTKNYPRSGTSISSKAKAPVTKEENAKTLVQSIKQRFGMEITPDDASWLEFSTRDPDTGERVPCGKLLVSIEILPKAMAEIRAAGLGRGEPNNFPVLAEPADRLHLSAMRNPMVLLQTLVGKRLYRAIASTLLCASFIAIVIFAGPLVNVFVEVLQLIPPPYGFITFILLVVSLLMCCGIWSFRCSSAIRGNNDDD